MLSKIQYQITRLLDGIEALPERQQINRLSRIIKLSNDTANLEATLLNNAAKQIKAGQALINQARLISLFEDKSRLEVWQVDSVFDDDEEMQKALALSVAQGRIKATPDPLGRPRFDQYELIQGSEIKPIISS